MDNELHSGGLQEKQNGDTSDDISTETEQAIIDMWKWAHAKIKLCRSRFVPRFVAC